PGTGLYYVNRTYKKKRRRTKYRCNASNDEDSITENEAVVEQYHKYMDEVTNLHQNSPKQSAWMDIKNTPAPFSPDDMGPRQKAELQKYHAYSPTFLERIFTKLADKKKQQLKETIHIAEQQDKKQYQKWKEQTVFATSVLEGNHAAYEQVIQRNDNFDQMRSRTH